MTSLLVVRSITIVDQQHLTIKEAAYQVSQSVNQTNEKDNTEMGRSDLNKRLI